MGEKTERVTTWGGPRNWQEEVINLNWTFFAIAPSFSRSVIQYGQLNGFQRDQINFRLVRGDGEIVEEIVSKEQQKEINKVMDI